MRLFFCSGEASGDAVAVAIVRALQALGSTSPELTYEGIGGKALAETGATMIADSSAFGVIGIADALKVYRRANRVLNIGRRHLSQGTPGIFIPIDYGYMNMKLCRHAKQTGWYVLYVNPPGSWRKDRQGQDLPNLTDEIVTPFSWSAEILTKMGARAHWFGHPIRQMLRSGSAINFLERTSIALLPGSRVSEVDLLLPVMAAALHGIDAPAEFAVAPTMNATTLKSKWSGLAPDRHEDRFTVNDTSGVLNRARAGVVCSGTATLEAALCGCPHVVAYRLTKATEMQARLMRVKPKYISQPNILLDEPLVPELIQYSATPENIRTELEKLLANTPERQRQLDGFRRIEALLGEDNAIDQTAQLIRERAAELARR